MELHHSQEKRFTPSIPLEIGDDILIEILFRVPWKSLVRFKCVSKHWLNLINSPVFSQPKLSKKHDPDLILGLLYPSIERQLNFIPFNSNMGLEDSDIEQKKMRIKALNFFNMSCVLPFRPIFIRGCCHGLILFSIFRRSVNLYVCNPITKQTIALPKPENSFPLFLLGLYLDEVSGHFQVVRIPHMRDVSSRAVQIFSSLTGTWRNSEFSMQSQVPHDPSYKYRQVRQAVHVGRSLYWLNTEEKIVAYDIDVEKLSVVKTPNLENLYKWRSDTIHESHGCLGEFGGMLWYVFTGDPEAVRVWVLRSNGWDSVTKVSTSAIKSTLCMNPDWLCYKYKPSLIPICFHCSDPGVVLLHLPGKLFSYRLQTEKVELLMDFDLYLKPALAFPYVLPKVPLPKL